MHNSPKLLWHLMQLAWINISVNNHTAVCCNAMLLGFCLNILLINLANLYNITEKTKITPVLTHLSSDKAASHPSIHPCICFCNHISTCSQQVWACCIFWGARWQWRLQKWWNAMKRERQTQRDMLVVLIHSLANPGNSYHQRETSTRGERRDDR